MCLIFRLLSAIKRPHDNYAEVTIKNAQRAKFLEITIVMKFPKSFLSWRYYKIIMIIRYEY